MRISLPIKLMLSYVLVAGLIIAPSLWFLRGSLVDALDAWEAQELEHSVAAVRDRIAAVPEAQLERVVHDTARLVQLRLTVIDASGRVLADSEVAPERLATLDNHRSRPEVLTALTTGGYGWARRTSTTIGDEEIYGALPLPSDAAGRAPPRGVIRLAERAAPIREAVNAALVAPRLAVGIGMSTAILLSLIAALVVAIPLRRMRDAARAFAEARWVPLKPVRTRDELDERQRQLLELGQRLRQQLVDVGAQEALLTQAVMAFPLPSVVLASDLRTVVAVNGAFRVFAGLTPANEAQRLVEFTDGQRLRIAAQMAEESGAPVELVIAPPGAASDETTRCMLLPLERPEAPPLWLFVAEPDAQDRDQRGPEAVHRLLDGANRQLEALWEQQPSLRPALAQLRHRLDEAAYAAGRPEASAVVPLPASQLVERAAAEIAVLHADRSERLLLDVKDTPVTVAESGGLAARAVRRFLSSALGALPPGRRLEVSVAVEPGEVKLLVDGAVPPDLGEVRELAQALGTDVGLVPTREREAAWLGLPRA